MFTRRTDDGTPFILTSSAMAEGTVFTSLTFSVSDHCGSSSAFSASTTRPPQHKGTNNSNTERSKQIEVEANTPSNSWPENTSRAHCTSPLTDRCAMATPLGFPVDPDV